VLTGVQTMQRLLEEVLEQRACAAAAGYGCGWWRYMLGGHVTPRGACGGAGLCAAGHLLHMLKSAG